MFTPETAPAAGVAAALVVVVILVARALFGEEHRLFTYDQERVIADAYGPGCIWNRTHGLPCLALLICLDQLHRRPTSEALWITVGVLAMLTGRGLPIMRTSGRCSGPIVRCHRWPASRGGSASIWNMELGCERHNLNQSDRWSFTWALRQWPWTFPVYVTRWLILTAGICWLMLTDSRARRRAER